MNEQAKLEAFEAAALQHLNDLYRTACRVVGDRTEANDLVQETYLQAWKSFHRFELGTNCRAWLYKILFHVIRNHQRKWYRVRRFIVAETEEPLDQLVCYEPIVLDRISEEEVLSAFARIPQHYREVVHLVDVEEFSYKEASDALDVPIGTIMSRLSRGRNLLRKELVDRRPTQSPESRIAARQALAADSPESSSDPEIVNAKYSGVSKR